MNKRIKDAIFGAIAGAAGTFVMGMTMGLMSKLQSEEDKKLEAHLIPQDPPVKLAKIVVEDGLGVEIGDDTTSTIGQAIRWGYGIGWGALYGVLRRDFPALSKAGGLPFGVGLSLLGWTVLLPMFELAPPPHKLPLSTHATGLVSHYAYAATVEGVCELGDGIDRAVEGTPKRTKPELRLVS